MSILATYITPLTGSERTVEILSVQPDKQVRVTPLAHMTSGYGWDEMPEWLVDQTSLTHIRMTCHACGNEFELPGTCACGWDPHNDVAISDEMDTEATFKSLREEYQGG